SDPFPFLCVDRADIVSLSHAAGGAAPEPPPDAAPGVQPPLRPACAPTHPLAFPPPAGRPARYPRGRGRGCRFSPARGEAGGWSSAMGRLASRRCTACQARRYPPRGLPPTRIRPHPSPPPQAGEGVRPRAARAAFGGHARQCRAGVPASSPRMVLGVELAEVLPGDAGIDLGGG